MWHIRGMRRTAVYIPADSEASSLTISSSKFPSIRISTSPHFFSRLAPLSASPFLPICRNVLPGQSQGETLFSGCPSRQDAYEKPRRVPLLRTTDCLERSPMNPQPRIGGGGGNRTPVREGVTAASTRVFHLLFSPRRLPVDGLSPRPASTYEFRLSARSLNGQANLL